MLLAESLIHLYHSLRFLCDSQMPIWCCKRRDDLDENAKDNQANQTIDLPSTKDTKSSRENATPVGATKGTLCLFMHFLAIQKLHRVTPNVNLMHVIYCY